MIDVVIVNYNSGQSLNDCLTYLNAHDNENFNIIVVDNASSDYSIQNLNVQFPKVELIENSKNKGFAQACNQGAKHGQAKHIAFINPDCFIASSQLSKLSETLVKNQAASLIGCRVMNGDGSLQAATRRRLPTFWRVVFHLTGLSKLNLFKGINIQDDGVFSEPIQVDAVNGACYLVKRVDFMELNGFDESYPLHFEDLDLFARLKENNKSIYYDANVEVKHLKGQSDQDIVLVKHWKKKGLIRYFLKHRPAWEARMVQWFVRT